LKHTGEVVHFLIRLHLRNSLWLNSIVCPVYIPIYVLRLSRITFDKRLIVESWVDFFNVLERKLEVEEMLGYEADRKVPRRANIHNQLFIIFKIHRCAKVNDLNEVISSIEDDILRF